MGEYMIAYTTEYGVFGTNYRYWFPDLIYGGECAGYRVAGSDFFKEFRERFGYLQHLPILQRWPERLG